MEREQVGSQWGAVWQEVQPEATSPRITTPPLFGLPRTINGRPMAWTLGPLHPHDCACCGQRQKGLDATVRAVLCGRCSLVLSDAFANVPKETITPEKKHARNRRAFREMKRRGASRKNRLA